MWFKPEDFLFGCQLTRVFREFILIVSMHVIKVTYQDITLAKGILETDVVEVEGRYYFKPEALNGEVLQLKGKGHQYYCPIKDAKADYYNLVWDKKILVKEVGWIYEELANPEFKKIAGKMAFYGKEKGVKIETNT